MAKKTKRARPKRPSVAARNVSIPKQLDRRVLAYMERTGAIYSRVAAIALEEYLDRREKK